MTKPKKPGPKTERLDGPLERVTLMLDSMTRRRLKVLGKDNESFGAREAARIAYDRYQQTVEASTVSPGTRSDGRDAPLRVG